MLGGGRSFGSLLSGPKLGSFGKPGEALKSDKPAKPFGAPDSDDEDEGDDEEDVEDASGDEDGDENEDSKQKEKDKDEEPKMPSDDKKKPKLQKGKLSLTCASLCFGLLTRMQLSSMTEKPAK